MKWERFERIRAMLRKSGAGYWGKSLEELLAGISAKYKGLVSISWLDVHRLYDFRNRGNLRFRLFPWRKGIAPSENTKL